MLNIVLNVLGISIVLYAVISLNRRSNDNNKKNYEEFETEEVIYDFKEILEEKEKEVELEDIEKRKNEEHKVKLSEQNEEVLREINRNQKLNRYKEQREQNNPKLKTKSLVRNVQNEEKTHELNSKNRKIIELHSIGLSNQEIAKQVSRSVREIDVILKIYNQS